MNKATRTIKRTAIRETIDGLLSDLTDGEKNIFRNVMNGLVQAQRLSTSPYFPLPIRRLNEHISNTEIVSILADLMGCGAIGLYTYNDNNIGNEWSAGPFVPIDDDAFQEVTLHKSEKELVRSLDQLLISLNDNFKQISDTLGTEMDAPEKHAAINNNSSHTTFRIDPLSSERVSGSLWLVDYSKPIIFHGRRALILNFFSAGRDGWWTRVQIAPKLTIGVTTEQLRKDIDAINQRIAGGTAKHGYSQLIEIASADSKRKEANRYRWMPK